MTIRTYIHRWWDKDPNVEPCPLCGCPIQATLTGTIQATLTGTIHDGMRAHYETVHSTPLAAIGGAS